MGMVPTLMSPEDKMDQTNNEPGMHPVIPESSNMKAVDLIALLQQMVDKIGTDAEVIVWDTHEDWDLDFEVTHNTESKEIIFETRTKADR